MTLEHKLKSTAEGWLAESALSPERAASLEGLIKKRAHRRRFSRVMGGAAVAAALLLLPLLSPTMRAWAEGTFPWIAQYIGSRGQLDQGWAVANSEGLFQEILAVAQDQQYTFRVHRILAGPTNTTIVYSVEGPDPQPPDFWAGELDGLRFNGQGFMSHASGTGEMIDGVYVGSLKVNPLPAEAGTLTVAPKAIGKVKGNWEVSFPVTRAPLTALARTITLDQTIDFAGETLQVRQIDLVPTETVVHLHYQGAAPVPEFAPDDLELITPDGPMPARGMNGGGNFNVDGNGSYTYRIHFPPLPAQTGQVTLRVKAVSTLLRDQALIVPLTPGARASIRDLPAIEVITVAADHAVLQHAQPHNEWPYHQWVVIDELGNAHRATSGGTGADGVATLRIDFTGLPPGRQATALESREIWYRTEGAREIVIPLD